MPGRMRLSSVRLSDEDALRAVFARRDFDFSRLGADDLEAVIDIGLSAMLPIEIIRPDDLVVLTVRLLGLARDGAVLRRRRGQTALLIVDHQPQAFGEQARPEITGAKQQGYDADPLLSGYQGNPKPPPVGGGGAGRSELRIAGPSRLVFRMPDDDDTLTRSLPGLLAAMRTWPLQLSPQVADEDPGAAGAITADVAAMLAVAALGNRIGGGRWRELDAGIAALAGGADTAELRARRVEALVSGFVSAGGDADRTLDRRLVALYVVARLNAAVFAVLPRPPGRHVTAIEMPYRLLATPLPGAGFRHADRAVTHGGITELWHSRLGTRRRVRIGDPDGVQAQRVEVDDRAGATVGGQWRGETLRFLWSPDYPVPLAKAPVTMPLDPYDRSALVTLSLRKGLKQPGGADFVPKAVMARRLMLTALGGDLEAQQHWSARPAGVDLKGWTHRAAIGRDRFVRVEYAGFLYPFGFAATLVKLTERKFQWRGPGDRVAWLRQRYFIVVNQRHVAWPQAAPIPSDGRELPFTAVECLIEQTPDLAEAGSAASDRLAAGFYTAHGALPRQAFWPSRGSAGDYRFTLRATDRAGRPIRFEMPLLFVSEVLNRQAPLADIDAHYAGQGARRRGPADGQLVRFADAAGDDQDVDLPALAVDFRGGPPTTGYRAAQQAAFQPVPVMDRARVRLRTLATLAPGAGSEADLVWWDQYLAGGLGAAGGVFAALQGAAAVGFGPAAPSDAVGGLATPDLAPAGLSARLGLLSAAGGTLTPAAAGGFQPGDFFKGARLLGAFDLADLLGAAFGSDPGVPRITTRETPGGTETRFSLVQQPGARTLTPPGLAAVKLVTNGGSRITLEAVALSPPGGSPSRRVTGELGDFRIDLFGCLVLRFDRLRFLVEPGRKPDVDADLSPDDGVLFGGPLEFVNRLRDFIPANAFSDPPDLQVTPAGITAGYQLALPAIQVGVMALTSVTLGAQFSLPFLGGPPSARFNFAERHNCFNLTVSLLGGGGFCAIALNGGGIELIEAQLDFGARIAIDLGVASGSVYAKGGFYFHYSDTEIVFEGFVELGGRLSVLGMISVSLTFHLSLGYRAVDFERNGKAMVRSELYGQATLVVEVEVLLFSASVEISVHRTFAGSEADPKFVDFVPTPAVWDEYCAAFA